MATSIPVFSEPKSPSESVVAKQLMDWVNVAFEYYANKDRTATVPQTMRKLADYLAAITNELRATTLAKAASTAASTEATKSEVAKKAEKSDEQNVQHCFKQQSISAKVNEQLCVEETLNGSIEVNNMAKSPDKDGEASATSKSANTKPVVASDEQCRICLEPVSERRFAILEHCDHKYCEACLRSWIRENPNQSVKCPTCRVLSPRVIIRDNFLSTGAEKSAEFNSMLCCAPHVLENDEHNQEASLETVDDDFVIIPQYQGESASDFDDEQGAHLQVEIESESQEENDGQDFVISHFELDYQEELDNGTVAEDDFEGSVAILDEDLGDYQLVVVTDTDESNEASSASEQSDSSWLDSNYEDATSDDGTSDEDI